MDFIDMIKRSALACQTHLSRKLRHVKVEKSSDTDDPDEKKVTVGICVMEKKALSGPMTEILDRLRSFGEFDITMFGDKMILEEPVHKWPVVECLIAFYSSGFPLDKAIAYYKLRKPFLVNDLESQYLLHDRRKVYKKLEECGIPTPPYLFVNRDTPGQELPDFNEEEDFIEVAGKRVSKPFVEKPVDGDDHSVMIYYPSAAGGGMKELFRKVGNRASMFHPDKLRVRRDGSFIYEEFLPTGGTDVKVYTVGPDYAHAEARKSPVVDGVVQRSPDGKEIRFPVLLSPLEKMIARDVCTAFGQAVCGFDLLRSQGRSYVCDVNGWSFVKNSYKYYDDAACVLRCMFLAACAPHRNINLPPTLPWSQGDASPSMERKSSRGPSTFGRMEELRCVIAVIRHGDRTPKQKVKLKVHEERLLGLLYKYNGNKSRGEAKLKSATQLQDLLDAARALVPRRRHGRESDSEADDGEHLEKLRHVKAVLEEGGHFSGIYRKVQLKPLKWSSDELTPEEEKVDEALLILKYGGVLTHAGRTQAENLGRDFRNSMYPGEGTGLLRLHSTYRHDLKIYTSDEGRVQMSAAAFAKGLLDLEGPLTPILVSLVSKDAAMLDFIDESADHTMEDCKKYLYENMTQNKGPLEPADVSKPWMADGVGLPKEPLKMMRRLVELTKKLTLQLRYKCKQEQEDAGDISDKESIYVSHEGLALGKATMGADRIAVGLPCGSEGLLLMFARWKKLERDIFNERKEKFDISKIPDIYDAAKYDLLHNAHLKLEGLEELYQTAKQLADGVIPNEYGINPGQKLEIGAKIARRLLGKILIDFANTREETVNLAREAPQTVTAWKPPLVPSSGRKPPRPASISTSLGTASDSETGAVDTLDDSAVGTPSTPPNEMFDLGDRTSYDDAASQSEAGDGEETLYRLDPKYANVRTPQRHVRTRLYFTSESHIHSLINVLRYCHLHEAVANGEQLVSDEALLQLFHTKELDYLTHIVLRLFENTEVPMNDPKRFRVDLQYSMGAALNPLEVTPIRRDHTLPILAREPLQSEGTYLTLETLERMLRLFAMPVEEFPPPAAPPGWAYQPGAASRTARQSMTDYSPKR